MRQVYGYGCAPGKDGGRCSGCGWETGVGDIVATEAAAIIRLLQGVSGSLHVTFEETTQAAWLYEVVRGYVTEVVVCDPRRNKLLGEGSKADRPDARKLAELLRAGMLRSVYHGHEATRKLKELVRAYETLSIDTERTMVRIKAVYRGRGIPTAGRGVYQVQRREQWLEKLTEPGARQRVGWLYEELGHYAGGRNRPCWPRAGFIERSVC